MKVEVEIRILKETLERRDKTLTEQTFKLSKMSRKIFICSMPDIEK